MLIGILGAGQLGQMLAQAGQPLGLRFRLLDPNPDACAKDWGDHVVGAFDSPLAIERFAQGLEGLTWEFENVPVPTVEQMASTVPSCPSPESLRVAQDRLLEKELFQSLGLRTAPFATAEDLPSLRAALEHVGLPAIVKTRRGGYDGKGQQRVQHIDQAEDAFHMLGERPLLVEGQVAFRREMSVLIVRTAEGQTATWPIAENEHRNGILHSSVAPAPDLGPKLLDDALEAAERIVHALGHVGVLCVELFEDDEGILCNEIAPRVHNSGHWTIEGAATSQFENHVRAVAGLPLGNTALAEGVEAAVMLNLVGTPESPEQAARQANGHLHWYGKQPRPGRKVGHITYVGVDLAEVRSRMDGTFA